MARSQEPTNRTPTLIGSVEKALSILNLFGERQTDLSVIEVSRSLGLNSSTTHHLIATLAAGGYLEQDSETRKYRLGLKALEIGLAAQQSMSLLERARPLLAELADALNESINLAVLDQNEIVYVHQATTSRPTSMFTRLGARAPLYCTGVGKVFLAGMEPSDAKRAAESSGWKRFTRQTLTSWDALEAELETIRRQGFAVDREEREEGVSCVAAPVRDFSGRVCAAISVSGPSTRIQQHISSVAEQICETADELSKSLGFRGR